jgi:Peptide methionine sulfoxide reductase
MSENTETAILAGGCYWIMQQLLRHRDGVISTRVGWTGGENDNPTEENNSGHAETVEVTFDLERISYRELLEYFFQVHRADLGERLVGSGYARRSSIRARSSARWPRRRSSTSTPRATGPARS